MKFKRHYDLVGTKSFSFTAREDRFGRLLEVTFQRIAFKYYLLQCITRVTKKSFLVKNCNDLGRFF